MEHRFLQGQKTASEIVLILQQLDPPIHVSARTVERDVVAIRRDFGRRLSQEFFKPRNELALVLARYDVLAAEATRRALRADGRRGAVWARIAIRASEAKTDLLRHIGLIDQMTLRRSDEEARLPTGEEIARIAADVIARRGEIDEALVSEAERDWLFGMGDYAAHSRSATLPKSQE